MRALLVGLLLLVCAVAPAAAKDPANCGNIVERQVVARAAGLVDEFAQIWRDATDAASDCDERVLFCLGQSLALGQLEAAYKAADNGASPADLLAIAEVGLTYGAPWQLEAGIGDLYLDEGQNGGGGGAYSVAGVHYQQALIDVGEEPVCGEFGASPRPDVPSIESLYKHLSAALLLADPLKVVTTKCAPCQWLFLSGVSGFAPVSRPLPITFPENSDAPTPEGLTAIDALLQCLKASGQSRIVLSGHTDARGGVKYNLGLSERRLARVAELLKIGGFDGEIALEARGETDPFEVEPGTFPKEDELRLSRRIEWREASADESQSCD